jgi:hypothetical protein
MNLPAAGFGNGGWGGGRRWPAWFGDNELETSPHRKREATERGFFFLLENRILSVYSQLTSHKKQDPNFRCPCLSPDFIFGPSPSTQAIYSAHERASCTNSAFDFACQTECCLSRAMNMQKTTARMNKSSNRANLFNEHQDTSVLYTLFICWPYTVQISM